MLEPLRVEQANALSQLKTPITLASKSEGACLYALAKYCDFQPEMSVNIQIPLDRYRRADFKIDNVYIEYHPIILQREFDSRYAQHRFNKTLDRLPKWAKHEVAGIMLNEFAVRYYNQRKMLIEHKHGDNHELILATGAESFFNDVIKRFSDKAPNRQKFIDEFRHNTSKKGFKEVLEFFGAVKV